MDWKYWGDMAFYAATFVTVLFTILYAISAPWWRTFTGRNIMAVMGSVALAFGYFSWAIAVGGIPEGFHSMRAVLFSGIALSVGWRVQILIRHHIIPSLRGDRDGKLENARQDLDGADRRRDHGGDRRVP